MDAPQRWHSDGSFLFASSLPFFIFFYFPIFSGADRLLNDQDNVINCFLVIVPAEFLCSKGVQIRHAFTSSQTLTNLKKEHINDAQLRNVISLTLLAACYQLERGRYWNREDKMFK